MSSNTIFFWHIMWIGSDIIPNAGCEKKSKCDVKRKKKIGWKGGRIAGCEKEKVKYQRN